MHLKTILKQVEAFNFLFSKLELQSGVAKRCLLDSQFMTDAEAIEKSLSEIEQMQQLLERTEYSNCFVEIQRKLLNIKDMNMIFISLSNGLVLDDIELFEIKNFCLTAQNITNLFSKTGSDIIFFPELESILNILDPDKERMPNFYIYDNYSSALKNIRTKIKQIAKEIDATSENDVEQHRKYQKLRDDLYLQSIVVEDKIRKDIATRLFPYIETLRLTLNNIARLDILMAKSQQSKKFHFTKPSISCETTTYRQLFNPHIQHLLEQSGKKYQAVDLQIPQQPCLITGANMAGKTVLLKTLCLAQYLFQFGFFVPAENAQICIADAVLTCMEDKQSELKGLSSFAAEILNVNNILNETSSGRKPLILIDELAQTTNPIEGSAIVNSVLELLYENKVQSVITTHFSNITVPCKKFRVKGFIEKNSFESITPQNVNDFLDYNLIEDTVEQVPMEALKIAKILGIDQVLLEKAEKYLVQRI
jgi:DNA mismatch repair ATPase MutS